MKIKMVVIDLELSTRAKRIAAAMAIPLLLLGGGAVAYANVPHAWQNGDVLTAEDLNKNFADVDKHLADVPIVTNWQDWSPVLRADGTPVTNQTTAGRWRRVGDSIEISVSTTFTGVPSGGGAFEWDLPNGLKPAAGNLRIIVAGSGVAFSPATGELALRVTPGPGSSVRA